MKYLLFLLLLVIPLQSAGQSLDSLNYHLNQAEYHIQQAKEHAVAPEITVPNILVEYRGNGIFNVEWKPFRSDTSDIYFRSPDIHGERWLTVNEFVNMHKNPVDTKEGAYPIQVRKQAEDYIWEFYLWTPADSSNVVKFQKEKAPEAELIEIETNARDDSPYMRSDFYVGNPIGFIYHEGKYRIYFQNRAVRTEDGAYTVEMVESGDLQKWSQPIETNLQEAEWLLTVDDEIQCWIPEGEGNSGYIWTDFDTIDGCQERKFLALKDWRIDGTLGANFVDGKYMQLGRVRGWRSQNRGGWGDDFTDYPVPEEFPEMKKIYEEQAPWFDIREALHDRRGISLHVGEGEQVWSNEIIVDPENVELPGFLGWEFPAKNGIGDFYSGSFVDETRVLIKVYWKEKDRLIDRSKRGDEFTYMQPQRRFRFTGETTVIAATLNGNEIEWGSFDSVFPYDFFARKAHPDVTWATCPECVEVGQFTQAPNVIEKDGYVYIPFQYRDDVHYESANDWDTGKVIHLTGLYLYKVPVNEFNNWWE